jgi:pimeloyl-ACP methyl ester carboxylesterase
VGAHAVRAHELSTRPDAAELVVLLPGLGLPAYILRLARTLARRGLDVAVLDLPGYRRSGRTAGARTVAPHIDAVGDVAARWTRQRAASRRVVVLGHSTGAQAALTAALELQHDCDVAALVMAGPTFTPPQRRLSRVVVTAPAAYRDDTLGELCVVPDLLRARTAVWSVLRSGLADEPERRVGRLRVPLVVTAGEHDAFAPPWWLRMLASCALEAPSREVALQPGSHNNPYTHPLELAQVVVGAACSFSDDCSRTEGVTGPHANR